jgi:hypothetical protein
MREGRREGQYQPDAPRGRRSLPNVSVSDIPIYPGAAAPEGGGQMSLGGFGVRQYTTSDSVDQVVAFYKEKLGSAATVTQNGQQALVQLIGANGYANIAISPGDNSGVTKITIQSISH